MRWPTRNEQWFINQLRNAAWEARELGRVSVFEQLTQIALTELEIMVESAPDALKLWEIVLEKEYSLAMALNIVDGRRVG